MSGSYIFIGSSLGKCGKTFQVDTGWIQLDWGNTMRVDTV